MPLIDVWTAVVLVAGIIAVTASVLSWFEVRQKREARIAKYRHEERQGEYARDAIERWADYDDGGYWEMAEGGGVTVRRRQKYD